MTEPLQPTGKQDAGPGHAVSDPANDELGNLRREFAAYRQRHEAERERHAQELQQTRHELAQARLIEEDLSERLHRLQSAMHDPDRKAGAAMPEDTHRPSFLRRMWNFFFLHGDRRQLQESLKLLRRSELFDVNWYLAEYPDVAGSHVDPVEHYLRFGAFEGRDPGPLFHTDTYLRDHPELTDGRINPLVHYLQSRQNMGR